MDPRTFGPGDYTHYYGNNAGGGHVGDGHILV